MIDALCYRITNLIKTHMDGISKEKEEIINYGLNIFIYQFLITVLLLFLSIFLGILKFFVIYLLVFGILRIVAGGAHGRSRIECFITSAVTIIGYIYLSKHLWAESYYPSIAILVFNLLIFFKYAPGDTEEKPIISEDIKKRKKINSILLLLSAFVIEIIIWHYDKVIYNVIMLASLNVSLFLTPIVYKLFRCKHSNEED